MSPPRGLFLPKVWNPLVTISDLCTETVQTCQLFSIPTFMATYPKSWKIFNRYQADLRFWIWNFGIWDFAFCFFLDLGMIWIFLFFLIWYFWSLLLLLLERQPCRKVGYACRKVSVSHNNSANNKGIFFVSFQFWFFLGVLKLNPASRDFRVQFVHPQKNIKHKEQMRQNIKNQPKRKKKYIVCKTKFFTFLFWLMGLGKTLPIFLWKWKRKSNERHRKQW